MNLLAQILPVENILLDLEASSKKRAFEQAGIIFENNQGVAFSLVFESLFEREKLGSTGLGQGVAVPHGRIKGLKAIQGAFFRLAAPVPFGSPDGKPVNMMFVMLVPEEAADQHLQILSELAQRFSDQNFRERLAAAPNPAAVRALFA
ncbi:MAG: PTS sugar transporter subunit IIA [Betaproteobacteria bacterium]|nr:PTS sugar transporter subunit IIA [Betaproteobacteria bacterium]